MVSVTREECDKIRCGLMTFEEAGWEKVYACSQAGFIGVFAPSNPICVALAPKKPPAPQPAVTPEEIWQEVVQNYFPPPNIDPCGHPPFEPKPPCGTDPPIGTNPEDIPIPQPGGDEVACAENLKVVGDDLEKVKRMNRILWWIVILSLIYAWSKKG